MLVPPASTQISCLREKAIFPGILGADGAAGAVLAAVDDVDAPDELDDAEPEAVLEQAPNRRRVAARPATTLSLIVESPSQRAWALASRWWSSGVE